MIYIIIIIWDQSFSLYIYVMLKLFVMGNMLTTFCLVAVHFDEGPSYFTFFKNHSRPTCNSKASSKW